MLTVEWEGNRFPCIGMSAVDINLPLFSVLSVLPTSLSLPGIGYRESVAEAVCHSIQARDSS